MFSIQLFIPHPELETVINQNHKSWETSVFALLFSVVYEFLLNDFEDEMGSFFGGHGEIGDLWVLICAPCRCGDECINFESFFDVLV